MKDSGWRLVLFFFAVVRLGSFPSLYLLFDCVGFVLRSFSLAFSVLGLILRNSVSVLFFIVRSFGFVLLYLSGCVCAAAVRRSCGSTESFAGARFGKV